MAVVQWRPRQEWFPFPGLFSLREEMDRFFRDAVGEAATEGAVGFIPPLDLAESEDSFTVQLDLPGVKQEDIEVSILGRTLTVKGEKTKESEIKEQNYHRTERFVGSFRRAITLPSGVDAEKVKATYKAGVLELEIPKKEEAKPKQITVQTK
ncbi:MAG TPA: Hsp20/alpha crystallin family protein [bacterium]|nr:Hsp20/alpha crystallin family protein [bacterium]